MSVCLDQFIFGMSLSSFHNTSPPRDAGFSESGQITVLA